MTTFLIIAGVVAYLFLGGVAGGYVRSLAEENCDNCSKNYSCGRRIDHNLFSIAFGTCWPAASLLLAAAVLGDSLLHLPERRAEKKQTAAKEAAERQKKIDEFLESQGVKVDWTKL